jgi:hypothetical protein
MFTKEDIEKIKQEAFDEALAELKQENTKQSEILEKLDKIKKEDFKE